MEDIIQEVILEMEDAPEEMLLNIKITGNTAKKYFFLYQLMRKQTNIPDEDINFYLLKSGIDFEIAKFNSILPLLNEENNG
jgi:hypothetical protein